MAKKSKRRTGRGRASKTKNRVHGKVERGRAGKKKEELFGFMAGRVEIVGDIVSPLPDWKYWRPAECLKK